MTTVTTDIQDAIDNYRAMNMYQRLLGSADAMRQLFIAERIWKGIKRIDMEEERFKGGME